MPTLVWQALRANERQIQCPRSMILGVHHAPLEMLRRVCAHMAGTESSRKAGSTIQTKQCLLFVALLNELLGMTAHIWQALKANDRLTVHTMLLVHHAPQGAAEK